MTIQQKRQCVEELRDHSVEEWSDEEVDKEFFKLMEYENE